MNQNLIPNILSLTQFIIALFISLRVFYLYFQARRPRLLILGLSMGILALTAIASFIGDNFPDFPLNLNWFKYISQTICFLFILLSLVGSSDKHLHRLMRWYIIISLLLLLLVTPIMPTNFPNPSVTKMLLGGSRCFICLIVSFYYIGPFMSKRTSFSLLMSTAFQLLALGYWMNIFKYFQKGMLVADQLGDLTRITGLIILLVALSLG